MILLLSSLFLFQTWGSVGNDLKQILSAQPKDVKVLRARLACSDELRAEILPSNCYLLLKIEQQSPAEYQLLDRICEQVVRSWRTIDDVEIPEHANFSPKCTRLIVDVVHDLRYASLRTDSARAFALRTTQSRFSLTKRESTPKTTEDFESNPLRQKNVVQKKY